MFFFPIETTHLLYRFFLSSHYLSRIGKDINHTNDVDASNASFCTNPIALRLKNIPTVAVATVVMSNPSPIGLSVATVVSSSFS